MAKKTSNRDITRHDVEQAQAEWADAIVGIGQAYTTGRNVVECATSHIEKLYGYGDGDGKVLFKPTKCKDRQFRLTFDGALSYFVGDGYAPAGFPEDGGFAIAPYIAVRFLDAEIITEGSRAIAMGNYFFTTAGGETIKVEYTFGYRRERRGLVIDLHHSSLPFNPC